MCVCVCVCVCVYLCLRECVCHMTITLLAPVSSHISHLTRISHKGGYDMTNTLPDISSISFSKSINIEYYHA